MADEILKIEDLVDKAYLAQKILENTNNGLEIIQFYLDTMRNAKNSLTHRIKAAEWLANNLWGKPTNTINVTGNIFNSLYNMSDEDLEKWLEEI